MATSFLVKCTAINSFQAIEGRLGMALLLRFLLLVTIIFTACTAVPIRRTEGDKYNEEPVRQNEYNEVHISQNQVPADSVIYPETFMLYKGPYASTGKYIASGEFYDGYPVYTGPDGSTYWKIYYRASGAFSVNWVLNGNVHANQHGTVAYWPTLFTGKI